MVNEVYADLGFSQVKFYLSTRPEKRVGTEEMWDFAENALKEALEKAGTVYQINPGDGAFYGPKIDIKVRDAIGRWHQCATIQLDPQMPIRLGAAYVTSENKEEHPVMIHRAVLGSVERFMGVLIEHCAGHFPVGLVPVQAQIVTVTENHIAFAQEVEAALRAAGVRVDADYSHEKLGAKIRYAQLRKIPYMLVIGDKEVDQKQVAPRFRDGTNLPAQSVSEFLQLVKKESGVFWGLDANQF